MRILVDTNILISAILLPNSKVANTLLYVAHNHSMVLCDQNITELREVLKRKKPDRFPQSGFGAAQMYEYRFISGNKREYPVIN